MLRSPPDRSGGGKRGVNPDPAVAAVAVLWRMAVSPVTPRRWTAIPSRGRDLNPRFDPSVMLSSGRWLRRSWAVIICLAVIAVADLLIWRWTAPYAIEALLDEPAHAATGLLGLATLGVEFQAPVVLAVLAGSLLIDADHLPHVFGSSILEHGVPRPYTHSLGTIAVLLVAALLLRNRGARRLTLIGALALALHFLRDSAEPGGPGVSLLWPLSDHAVTVAYGWYAALLIALAAIAIGRRTKYTAAVVRWSPRQ